MENEQEIRASIAFPCYLNRAVKFNVAIVYRVYKNVEKLRELRKSERVAVIRTGLFVDAIISRTTIRSALMDEYHTIRGRIKIENQP